ncbi:trafficking kinesin-binding protein milt-like isoform X2 [Homalodisca vitripennis]|nr:trafficking kinesin-binding protein milt-like isoform X2 [Homalodisca vitripennis]XP_046681202.1 trafficking kinesin-binding protein milt-like isoform X2 [Homalodisca vitripennis]XP_046681203.1 trafficking kinesin-binding protein milt-like isoform X2 [Homalodisca vitripennis]
MTKTYNDIEAVTRLLEEKEKDIELTARIGKELLGHNQKLEANVASLEGELRSANEKITQLTHELTKKTELIQILTNDVDDSGSEPGTPAGTVNWEVLQRRLLRLEEENKSLRSEATQLSQQTEECEAAEARLVAELAAQLALTRTDLSGASLDADRQREEALATRALADHLQEKLGNAEAKITAVTQENEELVQMVNLARETQCELATELAEVKEKYAEVMNLLQEAQETLRKQRKKSQPQARGGLLFPSLHTSVPTHAHNPDSLASELECSLFSELSLDSGIGASSTTLPNYKKVFETVRCASRAGSQGSNSSAGSSPGPGSRYPTLGPTAPLSTSSIQRPRMSSSYLPPHRLSRPGLDSAGASDSECSDTESSFAAHSGDRDRMSGTAQELEAALRRLTPTAVAARRAALSAGLDHDLDCRTPDSIMSTGSSGGYSGLGGWKLPDKLQIVKPMEGSATLHHWSELATPSLGGLLEERPGVKVRGGLELEQLGLELYTLSDLEEDDEVIHPGKSFQDTGSVYTYTTSTVMHPDDNTSVTHSYRGSQMCTATSSRMSSVASTPVVRSRRNSTSTFSSSLGLAKMLNERGIKAVTPSTLPTPMFSPTATPANSPDHSPSSTPDHSRSPSPSPTASSYSPLGLPGFLMSSGAELLRRTLIGATQSPRRTEHASRSRTQPENTVVARRQLKGGPGIVETLERIGLERLMSTTPPTSPPQTTQSSTTAGTAAGVALGVPGTPGSGVLASRLSQLPGGSSRGSGGGGGRAGRQPRVRADLGTVPGQTNNSPSSSLGTLSSMLFGRKGGLL